jgi:hypothetical protein
VTPPEAPYRRRVERKEQVMRILRTKNIVALVLAIAVASIVTAVAFAAVTSQKVINDTSNVHLRVVRTSVDGFDSGWHIHPGVAIVQVQEGSLQITQGSCTPKTVAAGETYIEVPHLAVRGVAPGKATWTTTLITNGGDLPQIPLAAYSPGNGNPCP